MSLLPSGCLLPRKVPGLCPSESTLPPGEKNAPPAVAAQRWAEKRLSTTPRPLQGSRLGLSAPISLETLTHVPLTGLSAVCSGLQAPGSRPGLWWVLHTESGPALLQLSPLKDTASMASSWSYPRLCAFLLRKMTMSIGTWASTSPLSQDCRTRLGERAEV